MSVPIVDEDARCEAPTETDDLLSFVIEASEVIMNIKALQYERHTAVFCLFFIPNSSMLRCLESFRRMYQKVRNSGIMLVRAHL